MFCSAILTEEQKRAKADKHCRNIVLFWELLKRTDPECKDTSDSETCVSKKESKNKFAHDMQLLDFYLNCISPEGKENVRRNVQ
jgi:hypothetical protein